MCTWNPDEVVELAIGESGTETEKPITVGQLFKNTVDRLPLHHALQFKGGDGLWKSITYTEYYDLCIRAAKSFLMVRTCAYCTAGILGRKSLKFWLFMNRKFDQEMSGHQHREYLM